MICRSTSIINHFHGFRHATAANKRRFSTQFETYMKKYPLHAVLRHAYVAVEKDATSLLGDIKTIIRNKVDINEKDDKGHDPLYYTITHLPFTFQRTVRPIETLVLPILFENGAKLDDKQFLRESAYSHLMAMSGSVFVQGRRAFLAKQLIDCGLIHVNKKDNGNKSPLYRTVDSLIRLDESPLTTVLIHLFQKNVVLNPSEYLENSPYHEVFNYGTRILSEDYLKNIYICFSIFSKLNKSSINNLCSHNNTPLDKACTLNTNSRWKQAIITLLKKNGAKNHQVQHQDASPFVPTLNDYYSDGDRGQWCITNFRNNSIESLLIPKKI